MPRQLASRCKNKQNKIYYCNNLNKCLPLWHCALKRKSFGVALGYETIIAAGKKKYNLVFLLKKEELHGQAHEFLHWGGSISGTITVRQPAAAALRTPLKLSSMARHWLGARPTVLAAVTKIEG